MKVSSFLVAALSLFVSARAQPVQAEGCVTTIYFFSTAYGPVLALPTSTYTVYTYVYPTTTVFAPVTTVVSTISNSKTITSVQTSIIPKSTVTVTSTFLLDLTRTHTESCPNCLSPTSTSTHSFIYTSRDTTYRNTVASTSTYTPTITTSYVTTTKSISTITTGNPPTTKRVTSTLTQTTVRTTVTSYASVSLTTTTITSGAKTKTTTVTKIAASPTADITIKLFSLQEFNHAPQEDSDHDTNNYNGSTAGLSGESDQNHALVPQNSTLFQYFVSPRTGRLIELSTDYHMSEVCGNEGCEPRDGVGFVQDGYNGPYKEEFTGAYTKCSAVCGQPLFCQYPGSGDNVYFDIFEYDFNYYAATEDSSGSYSGQGGALFVVGPTKGYLSE